MVNEWTYDDLPSLPDVLGEVTTHERGEGAAAYRTAALAHLNAHHPKPAFEGYCTCNGYDSGGLMGDCGVALHRAQYRANLVGAEADRLRRAHELAERERDQARRERDAAVARAEKAERELRGMAMRAETAERERDEWKARAEAAEARTAPAVTKAEIEKAVRSCFAFGAWNGPRVEARAAIDAVWALLSGDDPVVHVVRKSDIEDCQRNEDGDWEFRYSGRVFHDSRDPADRAESLTHHREQIAQRVAIIRAIEAEQAVDPVEELAGQIESTTREVIRQVCADLADVVPSLDPLALEQVIEVTAVSRKVAAHVLGQVEDQ